MLMQPADVNAGFYTAGIESTYWSASVNWRSIAVQARAPNSTLWLLCARTIGGQKTAQHAAPIRSGIPTFYMKVSPKATIIRLSILAMADVTLSESI